MTSIFVAGVIVVACVLLVKLCIRLGKSELAEKREKERLTLQLHPTYRQKLAEDRAHELASRRMALQEQDAAHKRYLERTRVTPGVYMVNEEPRTVTPFPPMKSLLAEEKETTRQTSQEPYDPPDLETVIEELRTNVLEFVFGLDTQTGQMVKTTLPKAVHIQLLGASGQGKSRQATSILTQLCSRNDQQHLHLALIDCEGETTAPFQNLPHARYVADEAKEAARTLRRLVVELERRDITRLASPVILIFVEEFLNLRRTMPVEYRDQALEDYTTLALRGRKRGMFLFSIGQTAYTEKAIRDAQMQFLSSMAFAIKPTAARSAGFTNTELLNRLYAERKPGQFLLERPAGDSILLAPYVESSLVSSLVGGLSAPCTEELTPPIESSQQATHKPARKPLEPALQAKVAQVVQLHTKGAGKGEIIQAIWGTTPGTSNAYKQAQKEYTHIMQYLLAEQKGE